ncbi:MAG TPA: DUF1275 family protein [Crenalkalicoccus sp.]|nr:DUF1275 family protein [Crenalkalicoccus sp.]
MVFTALHCERRPSAGRTDAVRSCAHFGTWPGEADGWRFGGDWACLAAAPPSATIPAAHRRSCSVHAAGPRVDLDAPLPILAGMLGVSAIAMHNARVQISLEGAPSTAVMTTNITRFMMDVGGVMLGRDPDDVAEARRRAKHTSPAILGFVVGCRLGASCEAAFGLRASALPAGIALLALAMGGSASLTGARRG